jgi:hypothetical protein
MDIFIMKSIRTADINILQPLSYFCPIDIEIKDKIYFAELKQTHHSTRIHEDTHKRRV